MYQLFSSLYISVTCTLLMLFDLDSAGIRNTNKCMQHDICFDVDISLLFTRDRHTPAMLYQQGVTASWAGSIAVVNSLNLDVYS